MAILNVKIKMLRKEIENIEKKQMGSLSLKNTITKKKKIVKLLMSTEVEWNNKGDSEIKQKIKIN